METLKFLMTSTFYPPYHIGGDAVHVKYLAEELIKRGHEVHVLHSLDAYRLKRKKRITEGKKAIHTHAIESPYGRLTPYKVYVFGSSSFVTDKFLNLVKEVKPEVVHHHNISLLGYNLLKKEKNYVNLYTAHDYWLICPRNDFLRYRRQICEDQSCSFCLLRSKRPIQLWRHSKNFTQAFNAIDAIIAPSEYMKKKLESWHSRIVHIPNFGPSPQMEIKNSNYNNYFLFVGVIEEHKGIKTLLNVFSNEKINKKLIIVGDGSMGKFVDKFIKSKTRNKNISYLRRISNEELISLYKNAQAVIIPSIWEENCPLVAIESLSVGTPVISSNYGGLPEIVEKIDKNLVFENDNLVDVIANFDKKKYSLENIKNMYKKYYSAESYIKKYLELIKVKW